MVDILKTLRRKRMNSKLPVLSGCVVKFIEMNWVFISIFKKNDGICMLRLLFFSIQTSKFGQFNWPFLAEFFLSGERYSFNELKLIKLFHL